MLRSLAQSYYSQSYEDYPSLSDVIEEDDVIDQFDNYSYYGSSSPARSTRIANIFNYHGIDLAVDVFSCDSPPYQPISSHDLHSDASDFPCAPAYTEKEAILMFGRSWHQIKEPRIAVSPRIFEFNPELTPSMRCRLINWLIEVCLHFRLHRETLYLTVYFIDRYLSLTSNVMKKSLQLLGISALFVAAKLEEIYPPQLRDFANVCDGACPTELIHDTEVNILMTLRWHLNVATPLYWLGLYMTLLAPHFETRLIERIQKVATTLLDLVLHTPLALEYGYSVLSAAALFHSCSDKDWIAWATGFESDKVFKCYKALAPFMTIVQQSRILYPPPTYKCPCSEFDRIVQNNAEVMQQLLDLIKRPDVVQYKNFS